jgi:LuxR family quorum sensing-dependent transcriptional regulator
MTILTQREKEVVTLLAQGKRQTDIARALCVSPRTVEAHVRNAREKTGATSAFDLAVKAAVESARE